MSSLLPSFNVTRPDLTHTLINWWDIAIRDFPDANKRGFDTLVIVTFWSLWKQKGILENGRA